MVRFVALVVVVASLVLDLVVVQSQQPNPDGMNCTDDCCARARRCIIHRETCKQSQGPAR